MSWLDYLPWNWKWGTGNESKTYRQLKKLQSELQVLTKKRLNISENKKLVLSRVTVCTISFTILYLCTAYVVPFYTNGFGKDSWLDWSLLMSPCLILPLLGYALHKSVDKWYDWRLGRWMKKIKSKRQLKDDILKRVEETETYANAVKIFKEFDRSRLKSLEKLSPRDDGVTETITTTTYYETKKIPKNKAKPDPKNSASIFTSSKPDKSNSNVRYRGRSQEKVVKAKEKPKFVVPAVPSLDADALKMATKRQGIHTYSYKSKSRNASIEKPKKGQLAIMGDVEDPREKEIRKLKEQLKQQQDKDKLLSDLKKEIELKDKKLEQIENEKSNRISIQGKLIKDRSSSNTTTSRAELIKQNKKQRARDIKIAQSQSLIQLNSTTLEDNQKLNESTPELNSALPSSQESLHVNASHNNLSTLKETLSSSRPSITDDDDDSGAQISSDENAVVPTPLQAK